MQSPFSSRIRELGQPEGCASQEHPCSIAWGLGPAQQCGTCGLEDRKIDPCDVDRALYVSYLPFLAISLTPMAGHMPTAPKSSHTVAVPTNKYPAVPPGLTLRRGEPDVSSPPGLSRSVTSTSSSSVDSALPAIASTQYDHVRDVMDGFVHISISPSQEARLYKEDVEVSPDPNAYVAEWEKMPIADVDTLWPTAGQVDTGENLWGDSDDIEQKKKKQSEILCTVHGIICKKGICQEYGKLLREKERAERDAARGAGGKGKGKSSPHCGVRY